MTTEHEAQDAEEVPLLDTPERLRDEPHIKMLIDFLYPNLDDAYAQIRRDKNGEILEILSVGRRTRLRTH